MRGQGVDILVGTTKGTFIITSDHDRSNWKVSGPHCDGWPINHVIGDAETGLLWAGGGSDWHGAGIWRSEDGGETWEVTRLTTGQRDEWASNDPDFAKMVGWTGEPMPFTNAFSQIWSLSYGHGTLYAGAKPARLLTSRDNGRTWESVEGLINHPSAPDWNPGGAGLVLHTILTDPG